MKYITATILFFVTFFMIAETLVSSVERDTVLSNENVTYKATQDESNIYLNVSTSDEKTMMAMVRLGVTIFFDIKGKKKQNVYVKYPSKAMAPDREKGRREGNTSMDIQSKEKRTDRITAILENNYSHIAEYIYFDDNEEFNILLNTLNIEVGFNYDQATESLVYSLAIPKKIINTDAGKDLSKLTLGVKTIKEKKKDSNVDGPNGNVGGINIGGQQGGQGRGGRSDGQGGRSGAHRGQGGGRPNAERQTKPTEVLLDFWFDLNKRK